MIHQAHYLDANLFKNYIYHEVISVLNKLPITGDEKMEITNLVSRINTNYPSKKIFNYILTKHRPNKQNALPNIGDKTDWTLIRSGRNSTILAFVKHQKFKDTDGIIEIRFYARVYIGRYHMNSLFQSNLSESKPHNHGIKHDRLRFQKGKYW